LGLFFPIFAGHVGCPVSPTKVVWQGRLIFLALFLSVNCWDSAPTESFWGSLKVARIHGRRFETRRQAMDEVIDWLAFYNHRRLHLTLGYVSPMKFEENWLAAQNRLAA